jgi:hypothetical protein
MKASWAGDELPSITLAVINSFGNESRIGGEAPANDRIHGDQYTHYEIQKQPYLLQNEWFRYNQNCGA